MAAKKEKLNLSSNIDDIEDIADVRPLTTILNSKVNIMRS
jgi:hypothetical protein